MESLIRIAAQEIGVKEEPGPGSNPKILKYAEEAGFNWVDDETTPWCSIFMNWVAKKAGYERTKKANARSWLAIGQPVDHPELGDVVVYWRNSPESRNGHVGIYMGYDHARENIYTLGGNQGNSVSITRYPLEHLLGFRRLREEGRHKIAKKVLRRGDVGVHVSALQDALRLAGFKPGVSDGIFGPKTEGAVRALQMTSDILEATGIFDEDTRVHLLSILAG